MQERSKCRSFPATRLFGKYPERVYLPNIFLVISIAFSRLVCLATHTPLGTPIVLMSAHQSLIWLSNEDKSWQHNKNKINLTRTQTVAIPLACHIYCLLETDKWQIFVKVHPFYEVRKYPRVGKCVSILPFVWSLRSVEMRSSVPRDTHSTLNGLCFLCASFSTTWKNPSSLTRPKKTEDLPLSACRATRGVRRRKRRRRRRRQWLWWWRWWWWWW